MNDLIEKMIEDTYRSMSNYDTVPDFQFLNSLDNIKLKLIVKYLLGITAEITIGCDDEMERELYYEDPYDIYLEDKHE